MISADVRSLTAALVTLFLASCGLPSPTSAIRQATETMLLQLRFQAGTTLHYSLSATTDGIGGIGVRPEPVSGGVTADETDHILSVARNGSATMDVTVANPQSSELPVTGPTRTMRVTVAPNGTLTAGSLTADLPHRTTIVPVFTTRSLVDLPDHPVHPGDTWTNRATAETFALPLSLQYDAHSRFDRLETIAGRRTAVIVTTARFDLAAVKPPSPQPGDGLTLEFTGTADVTTTNWLDVTAHALIRTEWTANVDATLTVEDSGPVHMTERITAERKRLTAA